MELAKLTSAGQVTIPVNIRKKLQAKKGDKIMFFEKDGQIILKNASLIALDNLQTAFFGVAEEKQLYNEEDVVEMLKDFRQEEAQRNEDLKGISKNSI